MQARNGVSSLAFFVFSHGNRIYKMFASKGSFEVKLLTRGTGKKAEMGRVREEARRSEKRKGQRKEMQVCERVEKSPRIVC